MNLAKIALGLATAVALLGFAAPASAGPWVEVGVDAPQPPNPDGSVGTGSAEGTTLKLVNSSIGTHSIFYAGPLELTIFALPPSPPGSFGLIAWCDDLQSTIDLNHIRPYYASINPADVSSYLNVGASSFQQIAGLTMFGTFEFNQSALTPELGAAFQMAMWELEYPHAGVTSTWSGDANFQTLVAALIAGAAHDYTIFTNAGWGIGQLEAPCPPAAPGSITKSSCNAFQGLIFAIVGRNPFNVPEPVTLSVFGFGLAGAAAMGRRRRRSNKS